jgi:hypothetical protein
MTPVTFRKIEDLRDPVEGTHIARWEGTNQLVVSGYAFPPVRARQLRDWLTRALREDTPQQAAPEPKSGPSVQEVQLAQEREALAREILLRLVGWGPRGALEHPRDYGQLAFELAQAFLTEAERLRRL